MLEDSNPILQRVKTDDEWVRRRWYIYCEVHWQHFQPISVELLAAHYRVFSYIFLMLNIIKYVYQYCFKCFLYKRSRLFVKPMLFWRWRLCEFDTTSELARSIGVHGRFGLKFVAAINAALYVRVISTNSQLQYM